MSSSVKKILLEFAINELTRPACSHVLQYMSEDIQTSRRKLLAAAVAASLEQSPSQFEGGIFNISRIESNLGSFFPISSESLELLIQDVGMVLGDEKCPYLSVQEGVIFVAWILCQAEETKPPHELVEPSISFRYLGKIIQALAALSSERISWPSQPQCHKIAEAFETNYGFPGVVGVLATCKLPIMLTDSAVCDVGEVHSVEDFYDITLRCPTVTLQVVMDHCGSMLDVCVGLPGSWSLKKVLRSSRLYSRLVCSDTQDESLLLSEGHHLLAGPEYPQLPTLITPYDLIVSEATPVKSCFNRMHGRALNSGTEALSDFLIKFSRLKKLNVDEKWNPMKKEFQLGEDPCHSAAVVTLAACVLHNSTLE